MALKPLMLTMMLVPIMGLAQSTDTWSNVQQIKPGLVTKVTVAGGEVIEGKFVSASADTISIRRLNSEVTIDRTRIQRVRTVNSARRSSGEQELASQEEC